jgi:predicted restriction endonuclease
LGDGRYLFLDTPLDITSTIDGITDETIEDVVRANKLLLPTVETGDMIRSQRVRKGQQAVRKQTLTQYHGRCALCDIQENNFLIASHIIGWAEREDSRGDLKNVICLCRFHDPLFEQGYLSLSDSFEVLKKRQPNQSLLVYVLDRTTHFTLPTLYTPHAEYLSFHRQKNGFD